MLNSRLNLPAIARNFRKNGRVVIPNFLNRGAAHGALKGLQDLTRRKLWHENRLGDLETRDDDAFCCLYDKYPLRNIPPRPDWRMKKLRSDHSLARTAAFLDSDSCHECIAKITGAALTPGRAYVAASRYRSGHFCGRHDDDIPPRKIAFILHLTRKWLVHWGGQFAVLDAEGQNVIEVTSPAFNTMVLFRVPMEHVVLPVSVFSQAPRYSISGWYCG